MSGKKKFAENIIHHVLKRGRRVCEAKKHDSGLEKAAVSYESRLPLVALFDPYIFIASMDVQFHEILGAF